MIHNSDHESPVVFSFIFIYYTRTRTTEHSEQATRSTRAPAEPDRRAPATAGPAGLPASCLPVNLSLRAYVPFREVRRRARWTLLTLHFVLFGPTQPAHK